MNPTVIIQLRKKAQAAYPGKKITPCRGNWERAVTFVDNSICLWFNTEDKSTHVVKIEIKEVKE